MKKFESVIIIKPNLNKAIFNEMNVSNQNNPFRKDNIVDFYKEETDQETKVSSIVIESTKLVA